ncbi:MAG TPA: hypothetical protein VF910_01395 [Candidatus Bathyarchaeia archaeon]
MQLEPLWNNSDRWPRIVAHAAVDGFVVGLTGNPLEAKVPTAGGLDSTLFSL